LQKSVRLSSNKSERLISIIWATDLFLKELQMIRKS